ISYRPRPLTTTLFPYTTLFRSDIALWTGWQIRRMASSVALPHKPQLEFDHRRRDDSILRPGSVSTTFTTFFNSGWSSSGQYAIRSEEHTSELQSRGHLVCRLLL